MFSMTRSESGPFGNRLDKGGLDAGHLGEGLSPQIMGVGPAGIADRRDVDKTDVQFLLRRREQSKDSGSSSIPSGLLAIAFDHPPDSQ
jgi:hypothetical protein